MHQPLSRAVGDVRSELKADVADGQRAQASGSGDDRQEDQVRRGAEKNQAAGAGRSGRPKRR